MPGTITPLVMGEDDRGGSCDPRECLAAARRGDGEAVAQLDRWLRADLTRYVQRAMGARARRWSEPEAIVQQSLEEVLTRLDRLPADADGEELRRRAFRTASSRIRDAVRNHDRDLGESALGASFGPHGMELPSDGTVTRRDTKRWVRELVTRLPERYREVVRLCALEELSYVDAAQRLGMQPDAVRKRYESAREALARRLSARDDG